MCGFTPTISDGDLIIVGYVNKDLMINKSAYKIPVTNITASVDQHHNTDASTKWTELTAADHYKTALVGGNDATGRPTADIKMYDNSNKSWKKIGSLSSARSSVAVAAVYNNAIIVIGGYTKSDNLSNGKSSSLTLVELGQLLADY